MLTRRTNILFDEATYKLLTGKAREEKKSIGMLVREAVIDKYKKSDEEIIKQRTQAVEEIMRLRKRMKPLAGITIRELIDYGRYR